MSTKYDFPTIHQDLVKHLRRAFPDNLREFDSERSFTLLDEYSCLDILKLVALVRECNVPPIILPLLFYACVHDASYTIKDRGDIFPKDDFARIVGGRKEMAAASERARRSFKVDNDACDSDYCRCDLLGLAFDDPLDAELAVNPLLLADGEKNANWNGLDFELDTMTSVLPQCLRRHKKNVVRERKEFFDDLPRMFGLPSWETLRRQSNAAN